MKEKERERKRIKNANLNLYKNNISQIKCMQVVVLEKKEKIVIFD
jgi:hypothetical protein